jgi:hypothetical protein
MHPYALIALDLANQRSREAEAHRLAQLARTGATDHTAWPRRGLAQGFALLSRGSAAVTRRLDECVADDLGRSLAPTD